MVIMKSFASVLFFLPFFLAFQINAMSQNKTPSAPPEWRTYAEQTGYRETPRYDATIDYAKRLDRTSSLIKFESFGKSGEGRELPLLIATEGETFTPAAAKHAHKAVILIQACIHAAEPD